MRVLRRKGGGGRPRSSPLLLRAVERRRCEGRMLPSAVETGKGGKIYEKEAGRLEFWKLWRQTNVMDLWRFGVSLPLRLLG